MPKWEGERLARINELAKFTYDRDVFKQEAERLFPGEKPSYLRTAVDNLRRTGKVGRSERPKDFTKDQDWETETKKDRDIARLKERNRTLEKLYKEQTKNASGNEALIAAMYELLPELDPIPVPAKIKVSDGIEEEELVLQLSDLHFGEVVSADETGGISSFDPNIAKRRFDYTIDKAITIAKEKQKGFHYRKLNVFLLGDLISGLIHDELKENDEMGVVGQMLFAIEVISSGILRLCQEFESVHVASVVGNHGRVKEQYYFKGKANNNFDYLVSKMLERLTAQQPNLTWNIPESFWTVEQVCGQGFFLAHGEFVKSWSGMPWYGLVRAYMKWKILCADYGISFNHMCVAHFHNPNVITVVRDQIYMNGSIKGGDEYSIGAIAAACDPVQLMFGVNPGRRGHTAIWYINSAHIR